MFQYLSANQYTNYRTLGCVGIEIGLIGLNFYIKNEFNKIWKWLEINFMDFLKGIFLFLVDLVLAKMLFENGSLNQWDINS